MCIAEIPRFVGPVDNVTVPVGREAILACKVDSLGSYKVSQNETLFLMDEYISCKLSLDKFTQRESHF